eukprot:c26098_g1_i1 orf=242-883(+)
MALLFGRFPLHLHPVPQTFSLHSLTIVHPRLTSSAIANVPFCKRSRIMCLERKDTSECKATLRQPSSLLKNHALQGVPLLANLLLPSVAAASAFGLDGLSTSHQLTHFILLADLDPAVASLLMHVLGPVFASLNFLFIIRIVMSWYPQLPVDKFPYVIAFAPTEPVLEPTRKLIPPVGGVDVSPVIWVALMSFLNEILLGQQGLLVLLSQQQG